MRSSRERNAATTHPRRCRSSRTMGEFYLMTRKRLRRQVVGFVDVQGFDDTTHGRCPFYRASPVPVLRLGSMMSRNTSSTGDDQVCTPLCSPERETGTLKIGFSDMMCDVGNAAIKDAIVNIARNRDVLHFLSCIARFLGHFSGLATIRSSGFPPRNAPNSIRRPWGV